jgi:hypothetical protein
MAEPFEECAPFGAEATLLARGLIRHRNPLKDSEIG